VWERRSHAFPLNKALSTNIQSIPQVFTLALIALKNVCTSVPFR